MTLDFLTKNDYEKILENRLNHKSFEIISTNYKPISEDVEGFMGEHYYLQIIYKIEDAEKTETFFIKCKPTKNKIQEEFSQESNVYKKEIFIFDFVLKEFENYGYDTSFTAKCYHTVPDTALIFENLLDNGYVLPERGAEFKLDQIKCVLNALARFHASAFAYEANCKIQNSNYSFESKYAEYLTETLYLFYINRDSSVFKWWESEFKSFNVLIDLLQKDDSYKKEFKDLFKRYKFGKAFVEKTNLSKILGHGDLWSNNMLFKYDNDKIIDCKLVDFQIVRYFYPSFDVILAIFSNTNPEFRKKQLNNLYQYYYNTLSDTLQNYGHKIDKILPQDDFYKSIKLIQADAMLQTLSTLILIKMPKEVLNNSLKDEKSLEEMMHDSSKISKEFFLKNKKYQEHITSILEEYHDVLLEAVQFYNY